jgi:hypothetical protein
MAPSDANGNYSLPDGYLATTGDTILASQHNSPLEDLAESMTQRLMATGAKAMTGPLKLSDGLVGAPAATFNSATTTGWYKTTDGIGFAVGGVKVVEFGSSGILLGFATANLPADLVTYAKMQNVSATARVLGRATSGAGDVEEIPLAGGLAISSGSLKGTTVPFTVQRFTSGSGTYTTPAGCTAIRIRMVGGGGGGGGGNNTSVATSGGNSTFSGGTLTAAGGTGGSAAVGGAGGSPTNGNIISVAGGNGSAPNGSVNGAGCPGGSSALGGNGGGGVAATGSGSAAAANTGGGGGGGAYTSGGAGASAGGGGAGAFIEHYISSPAASYTYAVGAGGAGQSGTGGGNGGNGAAGLIIVEEYY